MSGALSRREQMRVERRKQIPESALAVFSQKGFHASTLSDVAAHVGVSQGTIYWYFSSKEELFDAAIIAYLEGFGAEMAAVLENDGTASEKLRALAHSMDDFVISAQQAFLAFLGYWGRPVKITLTQPNAGLICFMDTQTRWWVLFKRALQTESSSRSTRGRWSGLSLLCTTAWQPI